MNTKLCCFTHNSLRFLKSYLSLVALFLAVGQILNLSPVQDTSGFVPFLRDLNEITHKCPLLQVNFIIRTKTVGGFIYYTLVSPQFCLIIYNFAFFYGPLDKYLFLCNQPVTIPCENVCSFKYSICLRSVVFLF